MKITHYLYNTFLVEAAGKKLAIDPGGLFFHFFRFTTLIPRSEWPGITHIFVTHGDPDHYWHLDRVAQASGAHVICNRTMARTVNGRDLLLGPRSKGLTFDTAVVNLQLVDVGSSVEVDGVGVRAVPTTHGPLLIEIGPLKKVVTPGPEERIGWGSIGYCITLDGREIVNLGDSLLHTTEWESIRQPDVLMIPLCGGPNHSTMNEREALQAVEAMQPRLVIPCHYSLPALFSNNYNPADAAMFEAGVRSMGLDCALLRKGDSLAL